MLEQEPESGVTTMANTCPFLLFCWKRQCRWPCSWNDFISSKRRHYNMIWDWSSGQLWSGSSSSSNKKVQKGNKPITKKAILNKCFDQCTESHNNCSDNYECSFYLGLQCLSVIQEIVLHWRKKRTWSLTKPPKWLSLPLKCTEFWASINKMKH